MKILQFFKKKIFHSFPLNDCGQQKDKNRNRVEEGLIHSKVAPVERRCPFITRNQTRNVRIQSRTDGSSQKKTLESMNELLWIFFKPNFFKNWLANQRKIKYFFLYKKFQKFSFIRCRHWRGPNSATRLRKKWRKRIRTRKRGKRWTLQPKSCGQRQVGHLVTCPSIPGRRLAVHFPFCT